MRPAPFRVGPNGLATLTARSGRWTKIAQPVSVRRGILRSRIHLNTVDGSKLNVRPLPPGKKDLSDCGVGPTGWGGSGWGDDPLTAALLIIGAVVMFFPATYMLVRELTGVSPRCKLAARIVEQITPLLPPHK